MLADGRTVVAKRDSEEELFWALRGGGGNFGVVTSMRLKLHHLPSVRSGMLVYPFTEAKAVLEGCAEIGRSAPAYLLVGAGEPAVSDEIGDQDRMERARGIAA